MLQSLGRVSRPASSTIRFSFPPFVVGYTAKHRKCSVALKVGWASFDISALSVVGVDGAGFGKLTSVPSRLHMTAWRHGNVMTDECGSETGRL